MKYLVISPLRHDQKDYSVGSSVELDASAAQTLIECGVVEKAEAAAPPSYAQMTVEQLKGELAKLGVQIPDGAKKADLVKLIEEIDAGGGLASEQA
jgi:hypothetical protein